MKPVRLRLSRRKGFVLQAASRAINGLPAINVARPNRDGNPFAIGRPYETKGARTKYVTSAEQAVALHLAYIAVAMVDDPQSCGLMWARLRGKNLACWCAPGTPCHANTLLDLANR